jgi:hypothetical protein
VVGLALAKSGQQIANDHNVERARRAS